MRRLKSPAALVAVACLLAPACKPRDKIRLEPTQEELRLKSAVHMADPEAARQLIRGFHAVEQNSWRWTMGTFSVMLKPPKEAKSAQLLVNLSVPDAVLQRTGPVKLTAVLGATTLGSQTWNQAGEHRFVAPVPEAAIGDEPLTVDFTLDKYLPAGSVDARELGVIVSSVEITSGS